MALELGGEGQEEQVGRGDAIDGGGEGRGDAVAELGRIGEILHHRDQPQHRADDAERGRVDAHALVELRTLVVEVLLGLDLDLEHAADGVGLGTVDEQLQPLLQESVGLGLDAPFERQQALLARDVAPLDDLLDELVAILRRRLEQPFGHLQRVLHDRARRLHQDRRDGTDDDDHEGGGAEQRLRPRALQDRAADECRKREHDADNGHQVHGFIPPIREPG